MGVIKKGILGGFSGKIGQVVGGTWKGINYMRSLPASVANPRTVGQTTQRGKFKGATQFFSLILGPVVQIFWNGKKAQMSGYNDIVQTNVENFNPDGTPIWDDLVISKGPLLNVSDIVVTASEASQEVDFAWTDNSGQGNAQVTDFVNLVIFNSTKGTRQISTLFDNRSDSTRAVVFDGIETGDILKVYVFTSRDGNNTFNSDSYYANVVVGA